MYYLVVKCNHYLAEESIKCKENCCCPKLLKIFSFPADNIIL